MSLFTFPPPTRRDLRQFGLVFGGMVALVFGVLLPWLKFGYLCWMWPFEVTLVCVILALAVPRAPWPLHWFWMRLGAVLGYINTRIILSLFFFLVITPIGGLLRLRGKDPLRRRWDPAATSYRQASQKLPRARMEAPY